ncbi:MAG: dihydropteroate synthase, partial [Bacteroidales bacterium]|nr:dihydropteroate synthase [Bacteroidales bacterium]
TEGLDILDIGAVSTRPGSHAPTAEEEWRRLAGPLRAIVTRFPDLPVSVDTYRADIARRCVENGADIINDISGGLFDEHMFETVGRLQVPYILMHTSDRPDRMQDAPQYADVTADLLRFFSERLDAACLAGISDVIVDPGFGFGKTVAHNFQLLAGMSRFQALGRPVLAGLSRKSMLWKPLQSSPENTLNATTCVNTLALVQGADILRVHDVREAAEAVRLFNLYNIH